MPDYDYLLVLGSVIKLHGGQYNFKKNDQRPEKTHKLINIFVNVYIFVSKLQFIVKLFEANYLI